MKEFHPLSSGSSGNCAYFATEKTKILIDAGISASIIKNKLADKGVSIDEIDAILISHEHTDHVRGLNLLTTKHGIPVITNAETAKGFCSSLKIKPKLKIFSTDEKFIFQDLEIMPFSIPHDAADPVGFTISVNNMKFAYCTDVGFVTAAVKNNLKNCDILFIESNHDPELVSICSRPDYYKKRVLGKMGHLSNFACAKLLTEINNPKLKTVYLGHISQECNTIDKIYATLQEMIPNPEFDVLIIDQKNNTSVYSKNYINNQTII